MNQHNFIDYCENLYYNWTNNQLPVEDKFGFDYTAVPEPYLKFGSNCEEICFLTTNPGGVMDFQKKSSHFFRDNEKYQNLSERLALYYEQNLKGTAMSRIRNMYKITNMLNPNLNGFTQFEISPFHSSSFPNKEKFAIHVLGKVNDVNREYIDLLTQKLKNQNCICIQSGLPDTSRFNKKWLELISRILSVDTNHWKPIYFKIKNERPTTGAFYTKNNGIFKTIIFNSGSNSIPNIDTMHKLIVSLKE